MDEENKTMATEFLLLGFQNLLSFHSLFFFLLLFYFVTLSINLMIIWLVISNNSLHTPMYIFLTQLSLSDIFLTSSIVPYTLQIVLRQGANMSFTSCLTQFYFFGSFETSECLFLTVMAYDRYLAICSPLHYNAVMNHILSLKLVILSWMVSFSGNVITTVLLSRLRFCGPNIIDHFFCDFIPLLDISCSDTSLVQIEFFLLCFPLLILPLVLTILSYKQIVFSILKLSSATSKGKAFSTCSSHLSVVSVFYGTLIGIYVLPTKSLSLSFSKALSLFYTLVTPMLNPIIYSLRNKDIKDAMKKTINGG